MYELILQLLLMISLAFIVYLMASAVPRVEINKNEEKENGIKSDIALSIEKLDEYLEKLKDKTLRKIKVFIMKADNRISKELNKDE